MTTWSTQHFNALAKEIREVFPAKYSFERVLIERSILTRLALNLAKRFKEDNERFDPLKFLDACSPDVDVFPLSEFWEENGGEE